MSNTVLQTRVDYNKDRAGKAQDTEIIGTYPTRAAAFAAARKALLDDDISKDWYAKYEDRIDDMDLSEWPYGEEVIVHALTEHGENFIVAVKAQPHSHRNHWCKYHGGKRCDCVCKPGDTDCERKACRHKDCNAGEPHAHSNHACDAHDGKKCNCKCHSGEAACENRACKHHGCDGTKR